MSDDSKTDAGVTLPAATCSAARDKWVADCIAYMVAIGIDRDLATSEAEAWIEDNPDDVTESPSAIADDIMSYWVY